MLLIAYFVALMIASVLADYLIGLIVEREFGGHVSLLVFLALYFLTLWVAWVLAVRMTKPKHATHSSVSRWRADLFSRQ
jgi:cyanate permease